MKKQVTRKQTMKGRTLPVAGLAAKVALVESQVKGNALPAIVPGDTVRVFARIKEGDKERQQAYEGVVMKMGNRGANRSFTVRKISHGVGVERVFLLNSPTVARVEVLSQGKVRRAKLYYLRDLAGRAAKLDRKADEAAPAAPAAAKP